MSNEPTIKFFNSHQLGQAGSLETLLDIVVGQDFRIFHMYVGNLVTDLIAQWHTYDEKVRGELSTAYERQQLIFSVADVEKGEHFQIWFELRWDNMSATSVKKQYFVARVDSHSSALFTRKEFDREYYAQRLLTLGEEIFSVLQPEFGWIERCSSRGYTKEKDVKTLAVPHIYWANFFGPNYVNQLGQGVLQNAPGWKKEPLQDGGFLYVLSSNMAGTGRDKLAEEVKKYFGVSSVRRK